MGLDFTLVDVFSDRPFGGNQLAVFPRAAGVSELTMQQLAREFNFSETTFVVPPDDPAHTCRVRIFTPNQELPFAGHPTIGTAAVLASGQPAREQGFVFEEGIGPVPISIQDDLIRFHLHSPDYQTTDQPPPAAAIASALGLPEDAIVESWYAGIGLRFCFVRLASPQLVDQARLDKGAWQTDLTDCWSPELYLFAGELRNDAELYARFFAPAVGVEEDPATGSACASLIASFAQRSAATEGTYRLRLRQGVAMGRPSLLEGTARRADGQLAEVIVGGRAVIVGHGTMTVPAG